MTASTIEGGANKHYTLDSTVAQVRAITIPTNVQITGQITVTTAGTPVQGPDISAPDGFFIRGMTANTGALFVVGSANSSYASTMGYELDPSQADLWQVENLNELYFDAATSGNKACWHKA